MIMEGNQGVIQRVEQVVYSKVAQMNNLSPNQQVSDPKTSHAKPAQPEPPSYSFSFNLKGASQANQKSSTLAELLSKDDDPV